MEAHAIVIKGNSISEGGYTNLIASSRAVKNLFEISQFDATTPDQVDEKLKLYGLQWNYPWSGSIVEPKKFLRKSAYATKVPYKRIACAISHYELWKRCAEQKVEMLIFEHDAIFNTFLNTSVLKGFDIIGLNDPINATFSAHRFHEMIQSRTEEIQEVPMITRPDVPQGLAGNSAYYINPMGAKHLLEAIDEHGLWPNDAIMCQQLINRIGVTRRYYTGLQNLKSTTTL